MHHFRSARVATDNLTIGSTLRQEARQRRSAPVPQTHVM